MADFIRSLTTDDSCFLWEMLYEAAHAAESGESLADIQRNPALACYVQDWGRPGDAGFVACEPSNCQPVGAVWMRLWSGDEQGYAYVDGQIPEVAIATRPHYRGQGIGTALLQHLIAYSCDRYPALALSVRMENPAYRLYTRLGFQAIPETTVQNRTGGQSCILLLPLSTDQANCYQIPIRTQSVV